jgi:hypothetical protein
VNVTASITNDTSGGALTLLSVASYALEFIGIHSKPVPVLKGQSNGVTPLPVAIGEYVEVTVQFAPTASTPDVCTATLQINGDTWNPVSLPITAAVGELTVSVPPITIFRDDSASAEIGVTSVAGNATTASLILKADASPDAANVTASLSPTSLSIDKGQSAFATLSVSASSNLPTGSYFWTLSIWAFDNAYGFSVPVTINVVAQPGTPMTPKAKGSHPWALILCNASDQDAPSWPGRDYFNALIADPGGNGLYT